MPGIANFREPPYDVIRQGRGAVSPGVAYWGEGGAATAPQAVLFPPEVYPIPGSVLFSTSTAPPGLNVTFAGGPIVLATVVIPAQSVGVVNVVEYGANAVTVNSLLTFAVRFNQGPVSYGPLTIAPARNAAFAGESKNPLIRVPLGTTVVDLIVSVGAADGATYLCGATLEGWYWNPALEQAYREGRANF